MLTVGRLEELQKLAADLGEHELLRASLATNWGQGDNPDRKKLAKAWTPREQLRMPTGRARIPAAALHGKAADLA